MTKVSPPGGSNKVYLYTLPSEKAKAWEGDRQGQGLIKVGETKKDAEARIRNQLQGVLLPTPLEPEILAVVSARTATGGTFRDVDIHRALKRAGVHNPIGEWFEATQEEIMAVIDAVIEGRVPKRLVRPKTYKMRPEQEVAVDRTAAYFSSHASDGEPPHFLWNAKMRFGKTFATYQLAKNMNWSRVLVLTYKPAVEDSWRTDLDHQDFEDWVFKGKDDPPPDMTVHEPVIWFASFQDVLGRDEHGNPKRHNEALYKEEWDCVVIDEYHFGAWRDAARALYLGDPETATSGDASEKSDLETPDLDDGFSRSLEKTLPAEITVRNYLYLSGTPFRALTEGEFLEEQVFNWTYSDEQRSKRTWRARGPNPYTALPTMNLMVYEMPDSLREVALNRQAEFSLTEFFKTEKTDSGGPRFKHEDHVQQWLGLIRGQNIDALWTNVSKRYRPQLPYATASLLEALRHTVWYLPSVDACTAMAELLAAPQNTFFNDYSVVVAAGAAAGIGKQALIPVREVLGGDPRSSKSITLSCGKLMTGVTVRAWAGIFMLRELQSPESYFQAAFRVQSPWVVQTVDTANGGTIEEIVKPQCYVLDFSPNRALRQITDYATKLRGDVAPSERDQEKSVAEFMEFMPVLAFEGATMERLDASSVIEYLNRGTTSTMLARRWNSPELLTLDVAAMARLLEDAALIESLEQIEMFRNIREDLGAVLGSNDEVAPKKVRGEPLTKEEKVREKAARERREDLKKRLQRFVARIPAFMYLTDDRERTIRDIITQVEPGLFKQVTELTLADFGKLVDAGVFNDAKMNDAVWKFRMYEEPSLRYDDSTPRDKVIGLWDRRTDQRFGRLIEEGTLHVGDELRSASGEQVAIVTSDYGLAVDGVRYATPSEAATAASGEADVDGWDYWNVEESRSLASIAR